MAVYTALSHTDIVGFLDLYDLGVLENFAGIAQGVSNTNYHIWTDKGRYILTLFEPRRARRTDIPFFLNLMVHMATKGVSCPCPIVARDGETLHTLADRPAVVLPFLQGRDIEPAAITLRHCAQIGGTIARLHLAAGDFTHYLPNAMGAHTWAAKTAVLRGQMEDEYASLVDEELVYLAQHWPHDLPQGAIHADLFPDNVFFENDRLSAIIDFYLACTDMFVYDLAITLNAWCFEEIPSLYKDRRFSFSHERHTALMEAYTAVRPLSLEEKFALPVLLRGAALRFVLSRMEESFAHDTKTLMTPKDPDEYIQKLLHHREYS